MMQVIKEVDGTTKIVLGQWDELEVIQLQIIDAVKNYNYSADGLVDHPLWMLLEMLQATLTIEVQEPNDK